MVVVSSLTILVIGIMTAFVGTVATNVLAPRPQDLAPEASTNTSTPDSSTRSRRPARGTATFGSRSSDHLQASHDVATVADVLKRLLPEVLNSTTTPGIFPQRLKTFYELYESLSEDDQETYFHDIELGALEQLYRSDPERAAKLLDVLFRRFRVLVP